MKDKLNKKFFASFAAKWQIFIVIASIAAIALHFILHFAQPATQNFPLFFIILIGGVPLFLQIIFKMLKGNLGADLLAAIALGVAIFVGQYLASLLLIIMLAGGQALEFYAMRKASSVLRALAERMPLVANKKVGAKIEQVNLSEVRVGDELVIYPHELSPIDGEVIDGHSTMDESYLTGEPYQISKAPGSKVLSGAINGDCALVVRAEKLAQDSRYATIMTVMEDAEKRRPQLMRLADQVGAVFTPLALIFALGTWYFTQDLLRFLAVLVVATPCPLLIAIPITIISAISMAAKRGIIIKDPTVLERLSTCTTAIFDKTGTLTYGQPELTEIIVADGFKKDDVLQKTASLERYSRHPLAYAILKAAKKAGLELLEAENVAEKPGQGLMGKVSGQEILVTSRHKLSLSNPQMTELLASVSSGLECIILIDQKYAATLRLHDSPRDDGHSFITHLGPEHNFNRVILLSGDRESEVNYLASILGIKETYASQTPEQKLEFVRAETKKAPTLFMGDGINDAPALTAATVGLAFGQHSSVTSAAAGAIIMENTLVKVDELMHISAQMRKIAAQSAIGGMVLSLLGMGLAAAGILSPVAGALAQEVIDVLAIVNALRMTWEMKVFSDLETK